MSVSPRGFEIIAAALRAASGLQIGPDKVYLLQARLAPVLAEQGLPDLDALAGCLAGNQALSRRVAEAMATHETFFFRDVRPFLHLADATLPRLHAARPPEAALRIWSAAASTGQEAYSVAIAAAERREELGGRAVEVLGTDLSPAALARAEAGTYSDFEIRRGLPPPLLARHFHQAGDAWTVTPALRATVRFRPWNLLDDPEALGRFDVILCRNVLLYFALELRARVLERLARRLAPDGLLVLGATETVLGLSDRFVPVDGECGAFALSPATRAAAARADARPRRTLPRLSFGPFPGPPLARSPA